MRTQYGSIVTLPEAQAIIGSRLPWEPSVRTLQRWANAGRHGGFRSRSTGRALFRTADLYRALRP
jgi:hypothetical protein